ncbi:MAG: hypothetical protein L6Q35_03110 [Phycisphaerales bacterium]|nr:hypothetical protein [Phycisphaerales bacterium]
MPDTIAADALRTSIRPGRGRVYAALACVCVVGVVTALAEIFRGADWVLNLLIESIAVGAALILWTGGKRRAGRLRALLALPVAAWATVPVWPEHIFRFIGEPLANAIPSSWTSTLSFGDSIGFFAAIIAVVTISSVIIPLYFLATWSWRVVLVSLASAGVAIAAVPVLLYLDPPDAVATAIAVPVMYAASLGPIAWWALRTPRREPNACPQCGYDLTGLSARACPECGGVSPAGVA